MTPRPPARSSRDGPYNDGLHCDAMDELSKDGPCCEEGISAGVDLSDEVLLLINLIYRVLLL